MGKVNTKNIEPCFFFYFHMLQYGLHYVASCQILWVEKFRLTSHCLFYPIQFTVTINFLIQSFWLILIVSFLVQTVVQTLKKHRKIQYIIRFPLRGLSSSVSFGMRVMNFNYQVCFVDNYSSFFFDYSCLSFMFAAKIMNTL